MRDTTRPALLPQEQAAEVLRAINDAELAVARVARDKSLNDDVLRFASVLRDDHEAMTELVDSLLQRMGTAPLPSAMSQEIRANGDSIAQLQAALDSGYNNSFVAEQIRLHEQALQLLDTALIPSARDTALKNLLRNLRPAFAAHRQRAQQILAQRLARAQELPARRPTPRPAPTPAPTPPPAAPPPVVDTMPLPPPTTTSNM